MGVSVHGVSLLGPGLSNWAEFHEIVAGRRPYHQGQETRIPIPDVLPPTERRRSSAAVRCAVSAALEALRQGGMDGRDVATVFATSDGDGAITHQICDGLSRSEREVSPTAFHNSVCNAPAGYWCIATQATTSSTTICAYDLSFAGGLLEAAALATVESRPVLLVASDLPSPFPLHAVRPVRHALAAAVLLSPSSGSRALMRWVIRLDRSLPVTPPPSFVAETLLANPIARCLPLWSALARNAEEEVVMEYVDGSVVAVACRPQG